jgi:cytochrome c oxidase subunit 2
MAAERAPSVQPASGPAGDGAAVFATSACVGCHTIRGVSAGVLGPDLTHFGRRKTLAAGMFPNTTEHLTAWILDPQRLKPGAKMPPLGLTEAQARSVAVYLLSLK